MCLLTHEVQLFKYESKADTCVDVWLKDASIDQQGRVGLLSTFCSQTILILVDDATVLDRNRLRDEYNIRTIMDLRTA